MSAIVSNTLRSISNPEVSGALALPPPSPAVPDKLQLCAAEPENNKIEADALRALSLIKREMKAPFPSFDVANAELGRLNHKSYKRLCEIHEAQTGKPFIDSINDTVWGGSGVVNGLTWLITGDNYTTILRKRCEQLSKP